MSDANDMAKMPALSHKEIETHIMSASVPKNEVGWWAHNEISKLRTQLAERDAQFAALRKNSANTVDYLSRLIREGEDCISEALVPKPVINGDFLEMRSGDKVTANRIRLRIEVMRKVADELHQATRQPTQDKE